VADINPFMSGAARPVRIHENAFLTSLRAFLNEPSMVGSAFPATRWLVDSTLAPLDWAQIRHVVEFGPGTGRFTKAILKRLGPQGRLIALETSAEFVRFLDDEIVDPRLQVIEAPARDVSQILSNHGPVDCILSGIPFSTLPRGQGEQVMTASCEVLKPAGQFIAYQMREDIAALLGRHFRTVRTGFEWRNIPPCHLYWARGKCQAPA
jgi:phospholipid N-methyltransferase